MNTPNINLNDREEIAKLIKSTESGMYSSHNEQGDEVVVFIQQGQGMDLHTYQSNGWIREDSYDETGLWEGDTFKGRWDR
ncbi:hypothetical protein [Bacillus thuringiensis]|uniref:hypothetical protein n=1 Tax=Bacillus thuringiensis TaxID=1428 RepID=UPI000BFB3C65|nr:hypothetical protein [Bacillus thuringiensis]PGT90027.1 hypothetical protein COD17_09765 [Bacillus thuringiensis]